MELNTENFTLDDIYHILDLVEDTEYTTNTFRGIVWHSFSVHCGEDVQYGEDTVSVEAGFHQLALDAHTQEWIAYSPPLPPGGTE